MNYSISLREYRIQEEMNFILLVEISTHSSKQYNKSKPPIYTLKKTMEVALKHGNCVYTNKASIIAYLTIMCNKIEMPIRYVSCLIYFNKMLKYKRSKFCMHEVKRGRCNKNLRNTSLAKFRRHDQLLCSSFNNFFV